MTKKMTIDNRQLLDLAMKDLENKFFGYLSKQEIDHLKSWMEGIEARVASLEKRKQKK